MAAMLALISAFLLPPSARAAAPMRVAPESILQGVEVTHRAVGSGSAQSAFGAGHALQHLMNGGAVVYSPSLHTVERAEVTGEPTDMDAMQSAAEDYFSRAGTAPPPQIQAAVQRVSAMHKQGRVALDPTLADNEMGMFRFMKGKLDEDLIAINQQLPYIGALVGALFGYATPGHEGQHAGNGNLGEEGVADGEIPAFQWQYAWLTFVDPTGEKLALLRVGLQQQMRDHPNKLTEMALNYAATLDVLRGTGGDEAKIRKLVYRLGYREGERRSGAGDGASPSA